MKALDNYECEGQMSLFDQDSWCGKMFQVHSVQTKEKTSVVSLKKQRKSPLKAPLFLDLRGAVDKLRLHHGFRVVYCLEST